MAMTIARRPTIRLSGTAIGGIWASSRWKPRPVSRLPPSWEFPEPPLVPDKLKVTPSRGVLDLHVRDSRLEPLDVGALEQLVADDEGGGAFQAQVVGQSAGALQIA